MDRCLRPALRGTGGAVAADASPGEGDTYVALLRGVNVGRRHKVSMDALCDVFVALDFSDVRTVIQSGNVIFSSPSAPEAGVIESAILEGCGLSTEVVLPSAAELREVVAGVLFDRVDHEHVHVGFVRDPPAVELAASLEVSRFLPGRMAPHGCELYFCLPNGMGRAKLPPFVDRRLESPMTIRNWNSVNRLAQLAGG